MAGEGVVGFCVGAEDVEADRRLWVNETEGRIVDRMAIGDAIDRMGIVARRMWLGAIVVDFSPVISYFGDVGSGTEIQVEDQGIETMAKVVMSSMLRACGVEVKKFSEFCLHCLHACMRIGVGVSRVLAS